MPDAITETQQTFQCRLSSGGGVWRQLRVADDILPSLQKRNACSKPVPSHLFCLLPKTPRTVTRFSTSITEASRFEHAAFFEDVLSGSSSAYALDGISGTGS